MNRNVRLHKKNFAVVFDLLESVRIFASFFFQDGAKKDWQGSKTSLFLLQVFSKRNKIHLLDEGARVFADKVSSSSDQDRLRSHRCDFFFFFFFFFFPSHVVSCQKKSQCNTRPLQMSIPVSLTWISRL